MANTPLKWQDFGIDFKFQLPTNEEIDKAYRAFIDNVLCNEDQFINDSTDNGKMKKYNQVDEERTLASVK